ncbi:hypothetical protein PAMP_012082 [Pampus punctatissimus]
MTRAVRKEDMSILPLYIWGVCLVVDEHTVAKGLRKSEDGPMPKDHYSFGVMSTPGGCAEQLRTEVEHAVLPRTPDAVCVIAPTNNQPLDQIHLNLTF